MLKVLNISHCIITEYFPISAPLKILTDLDESLLEKASRLDKFRTQNDEGFLTWYKYADRWKVDDGKSLAI
uniref:Uncharacterized protein n=1 Tax=Solanum lycopersicum TaxID=4081 RepID=A0A3Q7EVS2_SOLLC